MLPKICLLQIWDCPLAKYQLGSNYVQLCENHYYTLVPVLSQCTPDDRWDYSIIRIKIVRDFEFWIFHTISSSSDGSSLGWQKKKSQNHSFFVTVLIVHYWLNLVVITMRTCIVGILGIRNWNRKFVSWKDRSFLRFSLWPYYFIIDYFRMLT